MLKPVIKTKPIVCHFGGGGGGLGHVFQDCMCVTIPIRLWTPGIVGHGHQHIQCMHCDAWGW